MHHDSITERIANLWFAGKTTGQIVQKLGAPVTRRKVEHTLHQLRIAGDFRAARRRAGTPTVDRIRPLAAAGMTKAEIARELGIDPKRVSDVCRSYQIECRSAVNGPPPRTAYLGIVPAWVPDVFREDYRRLAKLYGEEGAATTIRKWKAEAQAPC